MVLYVRSINIHIRLHRISRMVHIIIHNCEFVALVRKWKTNDQQVLSMAFMNTTAIGSTHFAFATTIRSKFRCYTTKSIFTVYNAIKAHWCCGAHPKTIYTSCQCAVFPEVCFYSIWYNDYVFLSHSLTSFTTFLIRTRHDDSRRNI